MTPGGAMSGEFCVSIEDVAAAAGRTVQAGVVATDELSAGENRINGCSPDTFRGTAGTALGEFGTYLVHRRKSLETAVDDLVQGLRLAAATFDVTEADARQGLAAIQQSVTSSSSSVLNL